MPAWATLFPSEKPEKSFRRSSAWKRDRRPLDSVPYEFPKFCPVCGAPVYVDEDEAAIRCTSASCPAQLLRNLMHFASRDAMDIDGCGEGNLQKLIDAGLVKSAADLYDLTVEQLLPLGKKVDVWANNFVRSIEASKTRDLSRLLFAFGIRHVGQKAGRILSDHFGSLDALLAAPVEEMTEIRDIGQTTAESIAAWPGAAAVAYTHRKAARTRRQLYR